MDKPQSSLDFKFMALGYKFRDFFLPRKNILCEVEIKPGFHVLDYGCGPGSYIIPLTNLVGESGMIYALDIHPLAIQGVQSIVSKRKLTNVKTILSGCATGLPDKSIDVVLLYDILHNLSEPDDILKELHRVLKADGFISVTDHHLESDDITARMTGNGLFKLHKYREKTHSFSK